MLHSPQGRRSPNFLSHDQVRSPGDRRSPTSARSPVGSYQPTFTPNEKLSPNNNYGYNSDRRTSPQNYSSNIPMPERKSPIGPIPPITISNASETFPLTTKTMPSQVEKPATKSPKSQSPVQEKPTVPPKPASPTPQSSESKKPSVMKEILNFVRKPSKKVTTQTAKFAAAFTRRESGESYNNVNPNNEHLSLTSKMHDF